MDGMSHLCQKLRGTSHENRWDVPLLIRKYVGRPIVDIKCVGCPIVDMRCPCLTENGRDNPLWIENTWDILSSPYQKWLIHQYNAEVWVGELCILCTYWEEETAKRNVGQLEKRRCGDSVRVWESTFLQLEPPSVGWWTCNWDPRVGLWTRISLFEHTCISPFEHGLAYLYCNLRVWAGISVFRYLSVGHVSVLQHSSVGWCTHILLFKLASVSIFCYSSAIRAWASLPVFCYLSTGLWACISVFEHRLADLYFAIQAQVSKPVFEHGPAYLYFTIWAQPSILVLRFAQEKKNRPNIPAPP